MSHGAEFDTVAVEAESAEAAEEKAAQALIFGGGVLRGQTREARMSTNNLNHNASTAATVQRIKIAFSEVAIGENFRRADGNNGSSYDKVSATHAKFCTRDGNMQPVKFDAADKVHVMRSALASPQDAAAAAESAATAFTPGPWACDYDRREDRYLLRGESSFGHFCGWGADGVTTEEEDQANIRLIVAAPELLAALDRLQSMPNDPRAHRQALDALAKARA